MYWLLPLVSGWPRAARPKSRDATGASIVILREVVRKLNESCHSVRGNRMHGLVIIGDDIVNSGDHS